jgi:S1-C subfamily serine protease
MLRSRQQLSFLIVAALIVLVAIVATGGDDDKKPAQRRAATSAVATSPAAAAPAPEATAAAPLPPSRADVVSGRTRFDPAAVFRNVGPGVVTVVSVFAGRRPLGGAGEQAGLGSGFVIAKTGEVATNAHVVLDDSLKRAGEVYVRFADGNEVSASIVGADPNSDVALLKVKQDGLNLRPLALGSSAKLTVGTPVAAIGSPFGEERSLSVGVVSGTGRTIDSLTRFQISDAIQTDAAINHGNSGGPLVGANGAVVGINSQIRSTGGGGEGVGFAVPVDTVRLVLDQLRRQGRVDYGYLGVTTVQVYPQLAKRFGIAGTGAWVQEVVKGSPAEKAGIDGGSGATRFQAERFRTGGDVIVKVGGRPVRTDGDVSRALVGRGPKSRVAIVVDRDHKQRTVTVTLGKRPSTPNPSIG